jgi:hypothetical protein
VPVLAPTALFGTSKNVHDAGDDRERGENPSCVEATSVCFGVKRAA